MTQVSQAAGDLDIGLQWRNSFAQLGAQFYTPVSPQPLPSPYWVARSAALARQLGLHESWLDSREMLEIATGNCVPAGTQPLASAYSGHQFGHWAGQLGDGRAILLGESAGMEVQLKGSGLTPYSRMGDGRAVLRSCIREFLGSEAMHGLGIPSSRALCVAGSDAPVHRETVETAAVITRVAPSFVRFGHFEHFASRGEHEQLKRLADYVIDRHYPSCRDNETFLGGPYADLLATVCASTAKTLAQWQAVGFCHGVMNTDNMSILGLTIDYGPFGFLDAFDPGHICNHSDTQGRYAFKRQPDIAHWNLFCLANALLPLIKNQEATLEALQSYPAIFADAFERQMHAKLGLLDAGGEAQAGDRALVGDILELLAQDRVDYTIFWRRLSHSSKGIDTEPVLDLFLQREAAQAWLLRYARRLEPMPSAEVAATMLRANPKFVLRNHLAEVAIRKAQVKDFSEVQTLLMLLESPYDEHPGFDAYADFPPDWAAGIEISCSS